MSHANERSEATWAWLSGQLKGRPLPPIVAIIGPGDGALLRALDRHAPATRVLALEPDVAAAAAFASRVEFQAWRASGRLAYLAGPDYAGADDAWRVFPDSDDEPAVLVDPDLSRNPRVSRDDVARAAQVLKKILFGVKGNREARRKFAPRYLVNAIRNIPAMLAGSDVRALANAYTNIPAVIVGAGPSLDDAIDDLRELGDRALIISTDTALRPLLMSGISPQLVVGLDPSELNMRHFMALPECKDTWLVSEMALDRRATAVFEGRTFWFRASNHEPAPWLREQGIDIGQLDVWGSVLTGAFQLAVLAGCDPIVAVGADLAFTGGRPYARGTTYEFDWARNAAYTGMSLAECWKAQIALHQTVVVPDLHGRQTRSTKSLVSFRDWMVAKAKARGRRVINASGEGILFGDGVGLSTLRAALARSLDIAPVATYARRCAGTEPEAVAAGLSRVADALRRGSTTPPLPAWAEFSGPDFDAAALERALDETSPRIRTPGRTPSESAISWSKVAAANSRILATLPEMVARLRARLTETAVGGPANDATAPDIVDIEATFAELSAAIARNGHVALNGHVHPSAATLVSDAYAWPEPLHWAVLAFEAMLGAAGTPAREEQPSFWHRAVRPRDAGAEPLPPDPRRLLAEQISRTVADEGRMTVGMLRRKTAELDRARRLTGALDVTHVHGEAIDPIGIAPRLRRPRVLTQEGLPAGAVAYATRDGVVTVAAGTRKSLLVRPDGSIEPHLSWPYSIAGELPCGDGAVAWTTNVSRQRNGAPNHVMHRRTRDGDATCERLPFTPSRGVWAGGQLLWTCVPGGIGSWSPGEPPVLHVPDLSVGLIEFSDDGIVLVPRARGTNGIVERRRLTSGWRWRPGGPLEPAALGPYGGASCSATVDGWTATVFPEADLVRLTSPGATVLMTCYYPLRLAWCGRSLVVSTGERDVLMFEALADRLEAAVASAVDGGTHA